MIYLRLLLCLFSVHCAGMWALGAVILVWPETYHFRAVLKIPSANIIEAYEVWADSETENYRCDFYDGMIKLFRKQSENNATAHYVVGGMLINPESTGSYQNKEVCHELQSGSHLVNSVLRKTYLPLSGLLSLVGIESLNNVKTNKWVHRAKSMEYDVTVDHTVWTRAESVVSGKHTVWIPLRHEYRLLQGDRELDFMQHDYTDFSLDKPDSALFHLSKDLKCPLYASEFIYEAVDPILEFGNLDLEHTRTSNAFEIFNGKQNKQFKTEDDHFMRLQVFKNYLRYIQSINRQQAAAAAAVGAHKGTPDEKRDISDNRKDRGVEPAAPEWAIRLEKRLNKEYEVVSATRDIAQTIADVGGQIVAALQELAEVARQWAQRVEEARAHPPNTPQ